jgi:hypothetical protein
LEILNARKKVYEEARLKNPNRWARGARNWKKVEEFFYIIYKKK